MQAVCERIIIINRGKLIADDTASNLANKLSKERALFVKIICDEEKMLASLKTVNGVKSVRSMGKVEKGAYEFVIEPDEGKDIRAAIFERVATSGKTMLSFADNTMTLEQVFLRLTDATDEELKEMLGDKGEEE